MGIADERFYATAIKPSERSLASVSGNIRASRYSMRDRKNVRTCGRTIEIRRYPVHLLYA